MNNNILIFHRSYLSDLIYKIKTNIFILLYTFLCNYEKYEAS